MPISLPQEASSLRTGSHQRTILACARPLLVGHAVELATAQPPPTTTARSKPTPRLAQHRLCQLRPRGSDSGRPRAGHGPSRRPRRPRPSQPYGCLPHRRAPGPHFGRTQRTRQRTNTGRRHRTPDTGQRTPDSAHRTADTWTLRRPHRTPDTGHPDAGRGRGQADEARPASGPPGPPRRATATWDAQPCSCGRRLRRSTAHAARRSGRPSSAR
jgi:hypothetical protein